MTGSPIIVALDGMTTREAILLTKDLKDLIHAVKVNALLYEGKWSLECIFSRFKSLGVKIFADVKLYDIPKTVRDSTNNFSRLGADYVSVSVRAGKEAVAAALTSRGDTNVLVHFSLTSRDAEGGRGLTIARTLMAVGLGAQGVIVPANEVPIVRSTLTVSKSDAAIVVPGIRPSWYGLADDQHRTATPREAIREGADLLVVGRPITCSSNPRDAAQKILEETLAARQK